jgi:hypothetical protein
MSVCRLLERVVRLLLCGRTTSVGPTRATYPTRLTRMHATVRISG